MSAIHAGSVFSARAAAGDVVTVSGHSVLAFQFGGGNSDAHLKIDNDGKVYEQKNFGGYSQIDTADDWVRPTTSSPGLYQVRFTSLTGDALHTSTVTEDTWHSLSSGDFILRQRSVGGGFDAKQSILTVEIRYNGGAVLDSASYTIRASTEL